MKKSFYLGENIKQIRESRNIKQGDFAKKLNLSQAAVSQFESGARQPTPKTIEKMCSILEVNREELVGKEGEENFEKNMLMRNLKGMSPESIRALNEIAKRMKE
ncbi:MAG: helix-turn-helix transcriptional regulator [Balneolaceae bacterium]|nr:helix-turn-helix transcriptional regulator [Balneolaceae bacterium]